MAIVLGIESTAHTLGAGIVGRKGKSVKILSNEIDKFPSTAEGFIPRKLADHHALCYPQVLEKSLQTAGVSLADIDAVAYSQGLGIGHCLRVGYVAAKTLALSLGVPLIAVNHAIAHAEVSKFYTKAVDPLIVYVSGGNTQIIAREKNRYKVLGETLDNGIGNFLDVLGRKMNLSPPDAVGIMKNAAKWRGKGGEYIELPYSIKGMNLFFSGLQTKCEQLIAGKKHSVEQLCYSIEETAYSMLVEASERALCHARKKELIVVGGVAQNKRLQQMLGLMAREQKARFGVAPDECNRDNGAMIAYVGLLSLENNCISRDDLPKQDLRIDEQEVKW
ncbi:tRNA (adenosine(37)-N6)-threonylcarbamoyltransferase complex transferase subunit TsaD [Candidatus Micrarchaeota archaeon]|nr:tRNA (adenosine(37)-N6)-threonylcarbamoyltransferase complex transferase subunit TsaD [Candidatus Micrarchaeota archaeon]